MQKLRAMDDLAWSLLQNLNKDTPAEKRATEEYIIAIGKNREALIEEMAQAGHPVGLYWKAFGLPKGAADACSLIVRASAQDLLAASVLFIA